jgi:hypothetical protein
MRSIEERIEELNIDKGQIIIFSVIFLVIVFLLYGLFFSDNNSDTLVESKLDIPKNKAVVDYNTKLDAYAKENELKENTTSLNFDRKGVFGNDSIENKLALTQKERLERKVDSLFNLSKRNKNTYTKPIKKVSITDQIKQGKSQQEIINGHQNVIVKTEKKITPPKVLTFEEKLILSRQTTTTNTNTKSIALNPIEFTAVINGNQTAYNNAMITVRVLNDVTYNNKILKRNTYLYGVAKIIKTGRVKINFSNMTNNGKRTPINLTAYDRLDGYEGLLITDEAILTELQDQTSNEVNREVSNQGTVGRILSSVIRKKKKEIKIDLYDEHEIILKGHL